MTRKTDIHLLFGAVQSELLTALRNSAVLTHPVSKGDAVELGWQSMLKNHLPRRYAVGKGFVVDCDGRVSDFQDIVIYDRQYSPVLFNESGQLVIPAESVYAIFEVKSEMDKRRLLYAGAKAGSVRALRRTTVKASGQAEAKEPSRIVGGILATRSSWQPPFGGSFEKALTSLPEACGLDLGCVPEHGGFATDPRGEVTIFGAESAVLTFFLELLKRLQDMGTAPAIVFDEYAKALDSKSNEERT